MQTPTTHLPNRHIYPGHLFETPSLRTLYLNFLPIHSSAFPLLASRDGDLCHEHSAG